MKKEIMVKVCHRCGIVNTEKAEKCESCGAGLEAPIANSEAKKLIRQIENRNEETKRAIAAEKFGSGVEKPVDIPVTAAHIVIGVIGCIAAVCEAVIMLLSGRLFPEATDEMVLTGLCVFFLLAIAVLQSFMPGKMWTLAHCIDQLSYNEKLSPSSFGVNEQMISSVILILLGVAFITLQLLVAFGVL